jgi:hypothetical protein
MQKQTHFIEENKGHFPTNALATPASRRETSSSGNLEPSGRASREAIRKSQKQTHFLQQNLAIFESLRPRSDFRSGASSSVLRPSRETSVTPAHDIKSEKTKPLNPAFTGNRHARRRAAALARRRT